MMSSSRNVWLGVGAVALIQAAVLAWMIWDRAELLANGREVVLEVVPVDPRSLFRGDYVNLNYDIGRVPTPKGVERPRRGSEIFVTLAKDEGGHWKAVDTSLERPARVGADNVVLKGRVGYNFTPTATTDATSRVDYGIESYFVPEGKGRDLEKLVGQKKIAVLVAVDDDGNAGIKGLIIDGERVYEEPLF